MYLNSHKYPAIKYEKGEEIFLSPEETNWSFYFDVEEELTSDDKAMGIVASMIDEIDILLKTAKDCLKKILADKKNKYYETVLYFMEFHRDGIESDIAVRLFDIDKPSAISFIEMADFLQIRRFGSLVDSESQQQIFVMDLSFNPELTDELMVIYFDLEKQITAIAHES